MVWLGTNAHLQVFTAVVALMWANMAELNSTRLKRFGIFPIDSM